MELASHFQQFLISILVAKRLFKFTRSTTMLNGLGKDYKTRNFLEIENNLIRLLLAIRMLKLSHREFLRYFIVTGYMLYVAFVAHRQSRYCRSRPRVMCRRESRGNLKEKKDQQIKYQPFTASAQITYPC